MPGGQLWSSQQQARAGHFAGYSVCGVGPVLECAPSGVFVSFGHPDSSKTKGGPFERLPLIPGTPRCCLLDTGTREAAPQCRLR